MNILEQISKDDMVAAFLKAEISSPRWGSYVTSGLEQIKRDRKLVDEPDTQISIDNNDRAKVLDHYRGYLGKNYVFAQFPDGVSWQRVQLDQADLARCRYLRTAKVWPMLSGGTYLIADAGRNIRTGNTFLDLETERHAELIRQTMMSIKGGKSVGEVIVLESVSGGELVPIEGHTRLTAYAALEFDRPIPAILGSSPSLAHWMSLKWA